ncbi:MAG: amino acid ABC transporter substrate-binding protein [Hyphomicrobiales bacterium]|nr:MAG: amino acid ABC transporter substrate-binding protein [Hyphomicrobiales bacterium]
MFNLVKAMLTGVVLGTMLLSPAQADDLDKVKSAGQLSIALTGAYPPFSLINEQNQVVGFDVDIGSEIAKRMGLKPKIITTAWDGILAGLMAGKYDTIVGSMTATEKRKKVVDFVGPYYHDGRAIFIPAASTAKSYADLKGKKIGVTLGETHEKWANKQSDMNWDVRTYKGLPELLLELGNGRIDAIIIDSIPGRAAVKAGKSIKMMDLPKLEGGHLPIGIAIRKGNPQLAAAMQKALDGMMSDGTYEKISVKWVGADIR